MQLYHLDAACIALHHLTYLFLGLRVTSYSQLSTALLHSTRHFARAHVLQRLLAPSSLGRPICISTCLLTDTRAKPPSHLAAPQGDLEPQPAPVCSRITDGMPAKSRLGLGANPTRLQSSPKSFPRRRARYCSVLSMFTSLGRRY